MFAKNGLITLLIAAFLLTQVAYCGELEDNWNDFLHYTVIGRFDLAEGYAQKIIEGKPDPTKVLALSEANLQGYHILLRMYADSEELKEVSGKILEIIEQGRFEQSTDPKIINQEIRRLSSTIRGRIAAEQHLKNAGEYAIPFMLDTMADEERRNEFANITGALPKIGRAAIRPLVAALQMDNVAVKAEIIRALGEIGYPRSLGYLKYIAEKDSSEQLRTLAGLAIGKIDPAAMKIPAAELLYLLAESYYNHAESVGPSAEYSFANIWFWNGDTGQVVREEVETDYFNELMAMRCSEWALKADENLGKAISLWIAAFFKAESYGIEMPSYFDDGHPDAMTYATTAGAEYLHQALERALNENNGYVALGVVEALAANAGEKSLLYRIGTTQPLIKSLSFNDRAVRYSAAIAIGQAGAGSEFVGSKLIAENLAQAIGDGGVEEFGRELTDIYALRAVNVMLQLAVTNNAVVDLALAQDAIIEATKDPREVMQSMAGQVLARLTSPDAQRAIANMALSADNSKEIRIGAFASLAISAKLNARLLTEQQVDSIYSLIDSAQTNPELRSAAAGAYGALNLPSRKVKELILDQSRS